jgi:hypothetical protein
MKACRLDGPRRAAAFALALTALAPAAALAQTFPYVTVDPFDTAYAGSSGINHVSFRQNSIMSVESGGQTYQFATYYRTATPGERRITISRRVLGVSDWEIFDFGGTRAQFGDPNSNGTDGHNVISIGVDGDGYMHMSWGMHNHQLIYRRSTNPVLNANPIAFGTTNQPMTGVSENSVTYPQFYNLPDGDLLFWYRNGASGDGNSYLNRYDTTTDAWSAVRHPLFNGLASSVNAYSNSWAFDSQGRIHYTWTDRSTSAFQTNHNIYYARSPDQGVSWTKMDGTPYALPLLESTSEVAVAIPENSTLINQTSATTDMNDRPMVATWWAPGAAGGNHTRQYMLAYHNGTSWQTSQISNRPVEPMQTDATVRDLGRPIVVVDNANRAIVVMRYDQRGDVVTIAHSQDRQNWTLVDLTTEALGDWEPTYDTALWKSQNKLHLLYQPITGATDSTISVLEWDAAAYFNNPAPSQFKLVVDRQTRQATLVNVNGTAGTIKGYAIQSASGSLSPAGWRSLDDQHIGMWTESSALAMHLAEADATGSLMVLGNGAQELGAAFAPQYTVFRGPETQDLSFQFQRSDGSTVTGAVEYVGANLNNLTLLVDPETGEAVLINTSPFSVAIDGYSIGSVSGSLVPASWNSLDDQNAAGGDWAESNVNATALNELKPTSSLMLASGDSYTMGAPFNVVGGTPDLTFGFQQFGNSTLTTGLVLYTPVTPTADFDGDGDGDGGDFLAWQRGLGKTIDATRADGDADHDGDVDGADLVVWRAGFAASATANVGGVPEPAAAGMAFLGLVAVLGPVARLRR